MMPIIERLARLQERAGGPAQGDSYRVFHGRGHCFPGFEFIAVDYFQPVLLLTLFGEPPQGWLAQLMDEARPFLTASQIGAVLVQHRYLPGAPAECLWGILPEQVYARRGELRFQLHLARQQNVGFFLDMEPGRRWLTQHCRGKRVLNLFAYTCAFSVVALAAGAEKVVNVDMSSAALNLGRANHQLNGLDKTRSEFLAEDILKSWGRIKRRGPFDIVIIDPPSFQKGSFIASKDYVKVLRRLPDLLPQGGLVLACLNAPELDDVFIKQQFVDACPSAVFLERLTPDPDFPDVNPAQQLKLLIYELPG